MKDEVKNKQSLQILRGISVGLYLLCFLTGVYLFIRIIVQDDDASQVVLIAAYSMSFLSFAVWIAARILLREQKKIDIDEKEFKHEKVYEVLKGISIAFFVVASGNAIKLQLRNGWSGPRQLMYAALAAIALASLADSYVYVIIGLADAPKRQN